MHTHRRPFVTSVVVTTVLLFLLCLAYLPIRSNAFMTVSLTNLNVTQLYRTKTDGLVSVFTPGWENTTGTAQRAFKVGRNWSITVSKDYEYLKYGYREDKRANSEADQIIPLNLSLTNTNFCDEYSIGPWGYWGVAKTNGASHSVARPNLNSMTTIDFHWEPYALKNHTTFTDRASIWDIVPEGSSTFEDDNGRSTTRPRKYGFNQQEPMFDKGLRGLMRLSIIFVSISTGLNLCMCSIGSSVRENSVFWTMYAPSSLSCFFALLSISSISWSVTEIVRVRDALSKNKDFLKLIGVKWKFKHQMLALLSTCIFLCVASLLTTLYTTFTTGVGIHRLKKQQGDSTV